MRKIFIATTLAVLVISQIVSARAFDYNASYSIISTVAKSPTIITGYGEFYPVVNKFVVNGATDTSNVTLTNDNGDEFAVASDNMISGDIKYTDKYKATWADEGFSIAVPVMLQGPMDLGHINFATGSFALDSGDKKILNAMAKEIARTNLKGVYLVGRADPVGSTQGNLDLSQQRVQAAKTYLSTYLQLIGVTGVSITTEFMGDLAATAKANQSNVMDRTVEVTIYPRI